MLGALLLLPHRPSHSVFCSLVRCCSTVAAVQQQEHTATTSGPGAVLLGRYSAMLSAGVLKPDQHQQQLVGQLAQLLQQLKDYSRQIVAHRTARTAYEEKYQARLRELELQDKVREAEEQQQQQQEQPHQQQQAPASAASSNSSNGGWFGQLLGSITGKSSSSSSRSDKERELTPAQKARRAAAARAAEVRQELGVPPAAPAAPQGLYVYGSVGSGKSLLMDLFYDTARQELQLDHSRRMHFNAAMLELHSRLHHLDVQRKQRQLRRKQHEEARAHAAAAAATAAAATASPAAATGDHAGSQDREAVAVHVEEDEEEDEHAEAWSDAASDQQVSAWFDDAQWQQKEAKAAVLAIRKHLRATRAGRVPVARLAAANAAVMSAAARSFIRATAPDPSSGWEKGVGSSSSSGSGERLAALLCFDEMQVGDVFSAAALKALLEALTAEGCVVVTTSNRHPADLPRHGLHEAMFGHFLNTLFSSCRLFELSATTDYRRLSLTTAATQALQQPLLPPAAQSSGSDVAAASSSNNAAAAARLYFWPLGPAADAAMHHLWGHHLHSSLGSSGGSSGGGSGGSSSDNPLKLSGPTDLHDATGDAAAASGSSGSTVAVMFGRTLEVPRAAGGAAWFEFDDLCGKPLGSADYLALAQHYHTLFLSGVPAMSFANRDKARRFISLVDELYNARVALVCSAALPPDQLFSDGQGEMPLLDLEGLQFEGAVEGSKLRTDLLSDGGVAPVLEDRQAAAEAAALLGGAEERFAFARAVSRLYEMQSPLFLSARPRTAQ